MTQEKRKISAGIVIFSILLFLGSLYSIKGLSLDVYKLFYQPLSDKLIVIRYYVSVVMIGLGIVSAIGLFFLKNIFRKMALIVGFYILYSYFIEWPLFISKNLVKYIDNVLLATGNQKVLFSFWTTLISSSLAEFCFAISLIFYFRRSVIKQKFLK